MTAAALLRRLDAEATGKPWTVESGYHDCADGAYWRVEPVGADIQAPRSEGAGPEANARAICTTRNLLPLLAGLVEAVERADRESFGRHYRDDSNLAAVFRAFGALEAAAAKEGAK